MNMTHYMELLADNQPWNLLIFMALPVILAESVAISELYLLYTRRFSGKVRVFNRFAGIAAGVCFAAIIIYLIPNAVIPLTKNGEWRGLLDLIAVGGYIASGVPFILIALLEAGAAHRGLSDEQKMKFHAIYVSAFLVLGHAAMIAGMADPALVWDQNSLSAPHDMPAHNH